VPTLKVQNNGHEKLIILAYLMYWNKPGRQGMSLVWYIRIRIQIYKGCHVAI